jgi:plastocyanin
LFHESLESILSTAFINFAQAQIEANMGNACDSGLSGPSALSTKGKTFQHKFTEAGQHPYFCELHPMMVGKVIAS